MKKLSVSVPEPRKLASGNWFIQLRIGGESISITDADRNKCITRAMAIKAGLAEQKKKPDALKLKVAAEKYISDRSNVLSPSTIRIYHSVLRNHLQSIMNKNIHAITKIDVQAAVNDEAAKGSPKTVRNVYGLLTAVLREYTSLDLSRIKLPQREAKERVALSKIQLQALLCETKGTDIECQVLLASWLGLRRSEIIALKWDAVDLKKRTITVSQAMVRGESGMVVKGTKTIKSTRVLPANKYLIDRIKKLPHNSDFIFSMPENTMTVRLHEACDGAGIPRVGYHALRHTNASIMLLLGIPDKYAMERGGWANQSTMKYIYQHTIADEKKAYDDSVNTFFESILLTKNANKNEIR